MRVAYLTIMGAQGGFREPLVTLTLDVLPKLWRRLADASTGDPDQPLTLSQVRLLKRVAAGVRLVSELAAELDVSPPTISAAVDGLVRRGLLRREGGAPDRRTVPLALTAAGDGALAAAYARQIATLNGLFERMSGEDRTALAHGLRSLAAALASAAGGPAGADTAEGPDPGAAGAAAAGPRG